MRISDWSSDVCSSDLGGGRGPARRRSDLPRHGLRPLLPRHRQRVLGPPGRPCRLRPHALEAKAGLALLLQPAPGEGDALGAGEAALALQLRLQALLARPREALPRLPPPPLHPPPAVVSLVLPPPAADHNV